MFHTAETLFDPCSNEARCMEVTVHAGARGRIPPSRRTRQDAAEGNQVAQSSHSPTAMLLVVHQEVEWCHPLPHGKRTTAMTTRLNLLPVTTMTEGVRSAVMHLVGGT